MNNFEEHSLQLNQIPKRPSQQPIQPLAHLNHSSKQGNEMDNRSVLSEMATVKSDAIRPQDLFARKRIAISYPAVVTARKPAKPSLLARAASFLKGD